MTLQEDLLKKNKRQQSARSQVLALFTATIRELRGGAERRDEHTAEFLRLLKDDDNEDYRNEVLSQWARMKYTTALHAAYPPSSEDLKKQRDKSRRERKAREKIKGKLIKGVLNLVVPNGKHLGDCTGAECMSFGGWFVRVAEKVGPKRLVRDVLSEKQLRELYNK